MATGRVIPEIIGFLQLIGKIILVYAQVCLRIFRRVERKSIRGQNVLITGSGHGLGREMAIRYAQEGANLALVDINEKNNNLVREEVLETTNGNVKVFSYSVDIRDEGNVAKLAKQVQQDLGTIDILVNNAGIVQCLPILDLSSSLVERTFQINTMSHIWTIKHFLPAMLKQQRGHIVAISSIAGFIGNKYLADYCASKFAVLGLMEALDTEIHDKGANENIYLTTVCPSSMSTGMFHSFTSKFSWILPVLNANEVAERIIDATLTNRKFVVIPKIYLIFHRLSFIVPTQVKVLVQEFLDYGVKPHQI